MSVIPFEKLVDAAQIKKVDEYAINELGIDSLVLMENAACAFVGAIESLISNKNFVHILCGPGNNGGDGYAIARILKLRGFKNIKVIELLPPKSKDCQRNASIWKKIGETHTWDRFLNSYLENLDYIFIDAIFGTGLSKDLDISLATIISQINAMRGLKVSVDVPSGVNSSSGDVFNSVLRADITVTFHKKKNCFYLAPAKEYSGEVRLEKISLLDQLENESIQYNLVNHAAAKVLFPQRAVDTYKNQQGHVLSITGSEGMLGASILSSKAALKVGSGLVTVSLPNEIQSGFPGLSPDLMTKNRDELENMFQNYDAYLMGCGLGTDENLWAKLLELIQSNEKPMVLDADAFRAIKNFDFLKTRKNIIVTPHPGEFAQMTGLKKPKSNQERIKQALEFVEYYDTTLVLKGAPTIVVNDTKTLYINSTGNSGLAKAGTGDVLAGVIAGLFAQGMKDNHAAVLGCWLHGRAADIYAEKKSKSSLMASELIEYLEEAIKEVD